MYGSNNANIKNYSFYCTFGMYMYSPPTPIQYICGGALISPNWIITAQHVGVDLSVLDLSKSIVYFNCGINQAKLPSGDMLPVNPEKPPTTKDNPKLIIDHMDKIYKIPSNYFDNSAITHESPDICLLHLTNPINNIQPIYLSNKLPKVDSKINLIGFGLSYNPKLKSKSKYFYPNHLQYANMPVINDKYHNEIGYKYLPNVSPKDVLPFDPLYEFYAGNIVGKNISAGDGDSGSPYFQYFHQKPVLQGLVESSAVNFSAPIHLGITPVADRCTATGPALNWIKKIVTNNSNDKLLIYNQNTINLKVILSTSISVPLFMIFMIFVYIIFKKWNKRKFKKQLKHNKINWKN